MTATLDIDVAAFEQSIDAEFNRVKIPCQAAMAHTLATIINHNFGDEGEDRPSDWKDLSWNYARRFHDGNTTPKLQLSGNLQASVQIDESGEDAAIVFTENDYATEHQYGSLDGKLSVRPFFPIVGGELTEYSTQKCVDACEKQLVELLR